MGNCFSYENAAIITRTQCKRFEVLGGKTKLVIIRLKVKRNKLGYDFLVLKRLGTYKHKKLSLAIEFKRISGEYSLSKQYIYENIRDITLEAQEAGWTIVFD